MHVGLPLLLAASFIAAGCIGSGGTPTPPTRPFENECPIVDAFITEPVAMSCARTPARVPNSTGGTDTPDLPLGRTFSYAAKRAYDPDAEKVIVVAKKDADGYLLAGGDKDDLVYALAWGDALYGNVGRDLDPKEGWNHLEFPLRDGASWEVHKGLRVTARATTVRTPSGTEPGFFIIGKNEHTTLSYEYAPSVGWLTSYLYEIDGKPFETMTLRSVGAAKTWISYAPVKRVYVGDPAAPATLDITKADAVALSAGGAGGGRVTVVMPDGQTWTRDFPDAPPTGQGTWANQLFPSTPGKWLVSVQSSPQAPVDPPAAPPGGLGWGAASITPVSWITGA